MNTPKKSNDPLPVTESKDDEGFSTSGNMQKGWMIIAGFVIAMVLLVAMQLLRG